METSAFCRQFQRRRTRVGSNDMKSRTALSIFAMAMLLAGCNAGPDYVRPKLDVASSYTLWPSTQPAATQPARTVVAMHAAPLTDLAHWWEAMHDPELNSLLSRAVAGNLDVQVAIHRLQQSRAILAEFGGRELPGFYGSGATGRGTGNNLAA